MFIISFIIKKNFSKVNDFLNIISKVLADYMKYKYRNVRIGGDPDKNIINVLDKYLWKHEGNSQIRVVGAIETNSKKMRFDFVNEKTSENLFIFVLNHIKAGTHITHDCWSGYNFLNDHNESVWTH